MPGVTGTLRLPRSARATINLTAGGRRKVSMVTQALQNSTSGAGAVANFARISAAATAASVPSSAAADALNVTVGSAAQMSAIDGAIQFQRQVTQHGDCYLNSPDDVTSCLRDAQTLTSTFGVADLDEAVGYIQGGHKLFFSVPSYMPY